MFKPFLQGVSRQNWSSPVSETAFAPTCTAELQEAATFLAIRLQRQSRSSQAVTVMIEIGGVAKRKGSQATSAEGSESAGRQNFDVGSSWDRIALRLFRLESQVSVAWVCLVEVTSVSVQDGRWLNAMFGKGVQYA